MWSFETKEKKTNQEYVLCVTETAHVKRNKKKKKKIKQKERERRRQPASVVQQLSIKKEREKNVSRIYMYIYINVCFKLQKKNTSKFMEEINADCQNNLLNWKEKKRNEKKCDRPFTHCSQVD